MNICEIRGAHAQERRAAIELLVEDRFVEDTDNHTLLAAICDQLTPEQRGPLWEDLCERVEWRDALEDGADPGCDDDGRPEDRETVLEGVRGDIAALLDRLSADAPAMPLRRVA